MAQGKAAVIRSDLDIVIARTLARDTAKNMGFGAIDQARIATAVSELARNMLIYGGGGSVTMNLISKDGRTDFSFTVHRNEYAKTVDLLQTKVMPSLNATEIVGDTKICKVSIVGIGMRSHVGVASKMFRVLSEEGINIQMISTSEIKTSVVIDEKYMELAVRALHKAFDLDQPAA